METLKNYSDMPLSLRVLAERLKAEGKQSPLVKMVGWVAVQRTNNRQRMTIEQASSSFWGNVIILESDDCWMSRFTPSCRRYPNTKFKIVPGETLTHRIAYTLAIGGIPDGFMVCHRCDEPRCVNPKHLFLGTGKDNARDMHSKKRGHIPSGEKNGQAKLTNDLALEIRRRHKSEGVGATKLSVDYDFISRSTIQCLLSGYTWKHLETVCPNSSPAKSSTRLPL